MNIENLIRDLRKSNLVAVCDCGEEFCLSDALLFDGSKSFPSEALILKEELEEELKQKESGLLKDIKNASEKARITAKSVNVGKNLEKIFPAMKGFQLQLSDCRSLGDPIDLLIFNGFSQNNISSITFFEIKSGEAKLNPHQKMIKDAIEKERVEFKEI